MSLFLIPNLNDTFSSQRRPNQLWLKSSPSFQCLTSFTCSCWSFWLSFMFYFVFCWSRKSTSTSICHCTFHFLIHCFATILQSNIYSRSQLSCHYQTLIRTCTKCSVCWRPKLDVISCAITERKSSSTASDLLCLTINQQLVCEQSSLTCETVYQLNPNRCVQHEHSQAGNCVRLVHGSHRTKVQLSSWQKQKRNEDQRFHADQFREKRRESNECSHVMLAECFVECWSHQLRTDEESTSKLVCDLQAYGNKNEEVVSNKRKEKLKENRRVCLSIMQMSSRVHIGGTFDLYKYEGRVWQ